MAILVVVLRPVGWIEKEISTYAKKIEEVDTAGSAVVDK